MKKFLPIFLGILIPFATFLYLTKINRTDLPTPKNLVRSIKVSFGDENVEILSYSDFHKQKVNSLIEGIKGDYTIYIKNLPTNQVISIGNDTGYYAASLYKIPIAIVVLKAVEAEQLELDKMATYTSSHYYTGSGKIQLEPYGTQYSIEELLSRLIKDSDNVAQSMLLGEIDGSGVYSLMSSPASLTVYQMSNLLENLYHGEYLNAENTNRLLGYMSKTSFDNRIHMGLVKGITFSHKIGNWASTGSWHDCGIVFDEETKIVCLMSKKHNI